MHSFGQLLMVLWIAAGIGVVLLGEWMLLVAVPLLVAWIVVRQRLYRTQQPAPPSSGDGPG